MLKIIPVVTRLQAGFFSLACWRCNKEEKGLLRSDWVGFEFHGLWRAESKLRVVTLEGVTAGHCLPPARAV